VGERNQRKNHARKDRVRQAEAEHDTARHRNSTRKGVGHREANFACIASVDHFTTFAMVALLGGVELTIVGAPSSDIWTAPAFQIEPLDSISMGSAATEPDSGPRIPANEFGNTNILMYDPVMHGPHMGASGKACFKCAKCATNFNYVWVRVNVNAEFASGVFSQI